MSAFFIRLRFLFTTAFWLSNTYEMFQIYSELIFPFKVMEDAHSPPRLRVIGTLSNRFPNISQMFINFTHILVIATSSLKFYFFPFSLTCTLIKFLPVASSWKSSLANLTPRWALRKNVVSGDSTFHPSDLKWAQRKLACRHKHCVSMQCLI